MILNEDKVRRMIDLSGISMGSSGASGGGGGSIPAGSFVTPEYYSQNFGLLYKQVTTDGTTGNVVVTSLIGPQVMNALVIGNIMLTYDETNNAIKVVNRDGTTAANFYATGGVSALGYSPGGGGGGGADLNALLDSINTSSIGSTTPGASNVGKCLVWTANGWEWGTTGEGGGGTVTAITAGTGLSGGTITGSGTIAISSAYQGYISHGETAYGWGDHAEAGYATQQWVNQQGYVKSSGVTSVGLSMPTGFTVSGSPVTSSGTLTVGIASGYFMPTTTQRTTWNNKQDAISDLATIRSGSAAGATAVQPSAISDMATKTWVEDQGYVTSSGVTSVGLSMPTGFSVSGSPVTTSGTLSVGIASGYFIPTTTQRTTWNGKQDAISDLSTIRSGAAAGATAVQPSAISDMATQTWVGQQGFITASALSSYLPLTGGTLTGALHMGSAAGASPYIYWGDGSYAYIGEDADDHITLRGDKGVNILTGSNYELQWNGDALATQDWVEGQGYVTSSGVTSVATGTGLTGGTITTSGTISINSTYQTYISHGESAYGWGNHADQGYMLRTEGMRFADYGSYIAARFVTKAGLDDSARATKAQGSGYIEWWSSGGYFNHELGFLNAKGNVTVGTSNTDTTHFLQIGGGRIYWDNTNNALYVKKADGTACHFYSLGGISALGVGGGSSSASINNLEVRDLSVTDELMLNGNTIYMDGGNIQDAYNIQTSELKVGSGGSTIKKIYWNGTYLQVQIGSSTYNFRPV